MTTVTNFLAAANMTTITFPMKVYEQVTRTHTIIYTSTSVSDTITTTITSTELSPYTTWDWVDHNTAIDISGLIWFVLGVVIVAFPILVLAAYFRR